MLAPEVEKEPAGQLKQTTEDDAPMLVEKVPLPQFEHTLNTVAPSAMAYFPMGQLEQFNALVSAW